MVEQGKVIVVDPGEMTIQGDILHDNMKNFSLESFNGVDFEETVRNFHKFQSFLVFLQEFDHRFIRENPIPEKLCPSADKSVTLAMRFSSSFTFLP